MNNEFDPLKMLSDISEDDVSSQKYDRKVESNWGGKDDDEKADNDGT